MSQKNRNPQLIAAAKNIFELTVQGVGAASLVGLECDLPSADSYRVVGAGKAAMAMAMALVHNFPEHEFEGEVVVPHGYKESFPYGQSLPGNMKVTEAGHPIPDANSERAAIDALKTAQGCRQHHVLIVLLSGGASALWSLPSAGLSLQDLQTVNQVLLQNGATIEQINTVRKHLSAIKGGRLARAAWPAHTLTLAISDVVGNAPSVIGSGPSVPDPTTWRDAMEIAMNLDFPHTVLKHLELGSKGLISDTPKPGTKFLQRSEFRLLASNEDALRIAERIAADMGYEVVKVLPQVHGEARDVGGTVARILLSMQPGQCMIWGGETTVTVRGNGKGGRNQELVLAAAGELAGATSDLVLLSGGTDGIDGPTDAAGGWCTPDTVSAALSQGVDPYVALEENDAYHCLKAVNQLLIMGPTHTNVMDIGIGLVSP